ncbi:MAG: hypothetical protein E6713_02810 [Sporomusaceae bacterium]|nr:hypothetical protein [Sporomusaceae bacterium]
MIQTNSRDLPKWSRRGWHEIGRVIWADGLVVIYMEPRKMVVPA